MILEFSIKNFKSIKDKETISFEATNDSTNMEDHCVERGGKKILKMALILGPNASGKTNILLGLDFFMDYLINSFVSLKPNGRTGVTPFMFRNDTIKEPSDFSITFYLEETKYDYEISINRTQVVYEELYTSPKGQKKLIYRRELSKSGEYKYSWGETLTGNKVEISKMTGKNIPFLTAAAQLNHPLLKEVYDWFSNKRMPIILPGPFQSLSKYTSDIILSDKNAKKEILNLLKSADLSHISDIEIQKTELDPQFLEFLSEKGKQSFLEDSKDTELIEIKLKHKYNQTDRSLSLKNESKGTQRFYELCGPLITLMHSTGLLPVDELDTSLHQEVFLFFIKTFLKNSSGAQIIFTCHNLDILDTDLIRHDEVWLCEKDDKTGSSNYKCVSDFKGIRKDISLRKIYLSGKLGSRPITEIAILD